MFGFDKSYDLVFGKRNIIQKRLIALMLTVLVGLFLTSSLIGIVAGKTIIRWVMNQIDIAEQTAIALQILRWTIIVILFYTVITSLYRFGASLVRKTRFFSGLTGFSTTQPNAMSSPQSMIHSTIRIRFR